MRSFNPFFLSDYLTKLLFNNNVNEKNIDEKNKKEYYRRYTNGQQGIGSFIWNSIFFGLSFYLSWVSFHGMFLSLQFL